MKTPPCFRQGRRLRWLTINGAKALGWEDEIGCLDCWQESRYYIIKAGMAPIIILLPISSLIWFTAGGTVMLIR